MLFGSVSRPSADAADGADGAFERLAHPDYSAPGSTFTTEGNVNAKRAKKCLRAPQLAGEGARIFGPTEVAGCPTGVFRADPQKITSATRPGAALAHKLPHAGSDRVRVDHALDRSTAVGCVGACEGAGGP